MPESLLFPSTGLGRAPRTLFVLGFLFAAAGLRPVFGAHPDDPEVDAGGVAAKWAALGHKVKLVALTNGDIGHWGMAGGPLALRRTAESHAAAGILGIESQVLDNHDGELMVTLENRRTIARLI